MSKKQKMIGKAQAKCNIYLDNGDIKKDKIYSFETSQKNFIISIEKDKKLNLTEKAFNYLFNFVEINF